MPETVDVVSHGCVLVFDFDPVTLKSDDGLMVIEGELGGDDFTGRRVPVKFITGELIIGYVRSIRAMGDKLSVEVGISSGPVSSIFTLEP